jgi:photosystem II stability/assembly factor-like uncharacterized protein
MRFFCLFIAFLTPKIFFGQWLVQPAPSDNFRAVNFTSATNGLIAGEHGLYYTNNGGATWINVNPPIISSDSLVFRHTSFNGISYSSFYWVISGKDTVNDRAVIFRLGYTSTTATLVYTGNAGSKFNDISMYSGTAYAVGDSNLLTRSTDAGLTWVNYVTPTQIENYRSVASSGSTVTLLGDPGHIYYKTNSSSWSLFPISTDVEFIRFSLGSTMGLHDTISITFGTYPTGFTFNHNFSGGIMNASEISGPTGGPRFISTDHGIYVSVGNNWELQGSSSGYNLNGISAPSSTVGYAVGNNGLLLKTTNGGVLNVPYPLFSVPVISCENTPVSFTNSSNVNYQYAWKVNHVLFSNSYSPSYTFPSAGTYSITLVGTNGTYSDSLTRIITVYGVPDVNKTVSVVDSVICRTGSSDITINNSDTGVVYYLYKVPNASPIDNVNGNGTSVTLNTGVINTTSRFVISAQYQSLGCAGYFTDTIQVQVDHTYANLGMSLYSAHPGESVNYFQHCIDADHYRWYFGGNATPSFDSIADPIGITYQNTGTNMVHLAVWDNIGCYDSTSAVGAFCFSDTMQPLTDSSCWAIKYVGYGNSGDNSAMQCDEHNHLLIGGGIQSGGTFTTRLGSPRNIVGSSGIFISEYSRKGVLRWNIHSNSLNACNSCPVVSDIRILPDGDILAAGTVQDQSWFYFGNAGRDSLLAVSGYYVMRMDSLGNRKWFTQLSRYPNTLWYGFTDMSMTVDSSGRIFVAGTRFPNYFFNTGSGTHTLPVIPQTSLFIARLNGNGDLVWISDITKSNPVSTGDPDFRITKLASNSNGDLFFIGTNSFSPGSTVTFGAVNGPNLVLTAPQEKDVLIGCYDTTGAVRWSMKITTNPFDNTGSDQSPEQGVVCDENGNVYFAGRMADSALIPSVSGPDINYTGRSAYVICSYDRNGNRRWVTGAEGASSAEGGVFSLVSDKKNNITTCAFFDYYNQLNPPRKVFSSNGSYTLVPLSESSSYVIRYDTLGILQFITSESGVISPNTNQRVSGIICASDSGTLYMSGDVNTLSALTNTNINGNIMNFFTEGSFVTEFNSSCIPTNIFIGTGIQSENIEMQDFTVSPNPADESFSLYSLALPVNITSIQIFDEIGQEVTQLNQPFTSDIIQIDSRNLPDGLYYLIVWTGGVRSARKILVRH